jgi:hypothetical protein
MDNNEILMTMDRIIHLQKMFEPLKSEIEGEETILFEEWMYLCDQVVESFKLPKTQKYLKLLDGLNESNKEEIISKLKEERITYLASPPKTFRAILLDAKTNPSAFEEFIGEMDLINHCYNEFLFNHVWLGGLADVDKVLKEFELTKKDSSTLNELGVLFFSLQLNQEQERIKQLKAYGYQFIDHYLRYIRCEIRGEGVIINKK